MAGIFLIFLPLIVAAWLELGPVAGIAGSALFVVMFVISIQPGAGLFDHGPYRSSRRSPSDNESKDRAADSPGE